VRIRNKIASIRWKKSLKHVRFCGAEDYRVHERQIFEVAFEIPETERAFLDFCASLGITVERLQAGDAVARVGTAYKPDVWKTLKFPIPAFPDLAQPKDTTVAGVAAHVWIRNRYMEIVIAPAADPFFVNEDDFRRAKVIDDLLASRSDLRFRANE